jgi:acetate kinase
LALEGQTITGSRRPDNQTGAFDEVMALMEQAGLASSVDAVGHRVVHGGLRFSEPMLITSEVLDGIRNAGALAPLHNNPSLDIIEAAGARFGQRVPMIATFDTAFYRDLPDVAAQYALPKAVREQYGIRRFGFHGLAHRYMVEAYRAERPDLSTPRVISLQLGNGCSVTASIGGRPIDTSMGFTPLEGLIMGTRSGDIDPAIPLHLAKSGMSANDVDTMLNRESGLLGLSGSSSDMATLLTRAGQGDANTDLAVRAFCYRARKYVGAYMAALAGADAVLFGGGIGENMPTVRAGICEGLEWAGLAVDAPRNREPLAGDRRISADGSRVDVRVIRVNEAMVIAKDVLSALWPRATL